MPNFLYYEEGIAPDIRAELELRGHHTMLRKDVGCVQFILFEESGMTAVSDPRKGGKPAAY